METTFLSALWFLPFVLPICILAAFNDMKSMKIPNLLVLALLATFILIGPFALGFETWAWRLTHFVVVLFCGILLYATGQLGAGDAKFAAAMAPFVARADFGMFFSLVAACLIIALLGHRILGAIPAIRNRTPDWASWTTDADARWYKRRFPVGLSLAMSLVIYYLLALYAG